MARTRSIAAERVLILPQPDSARSAAAIGMAADAEQLLALLVSANGLLPELAHATTNSTATISLRFICLFPEVCSSGKHQ